jgi:hypothetical protein
MKEDRLIALLGWIIKAYYAESPVTTDVYHPDECPCLRCAVVKKGEGG